MSLEWRRSVAKAAKPSSSIAVLGASRHDQLITSTVAQMGTATWVVAEAHLAPLAVKFQG